MTVPDVPYGAPDREAILRRFHGHRYRWTPSYLPFIEQHLGDQDGYVKGHPAFCGGPRRDKKHDGRYPCGKFHWCTYCHERKCRQGGVLALFTHARAPNVVKFSVSLPASRTDQGQVKAARKAFIKRCREAGFDRWTVWVHAFGENPAQGLKGHLDGFVSGPEDADVSIFWDDGRGFREALAKHHRGERLWGVHVHSRELDCRARDHVKDLVLGGMYAGRPTFNTRRIYAGLYTDGDFRVRLTTVNRKTKRPEQVERLRVEGHVQPDWSEDELHLALKRAEAWKPRVAVSRRQACHGDMDELLLETNWRRKYRLATKFQLEEWYG